MDAALDATNVARVAHYIRGRTRPGADNGFQSIVISLKVNGFAAWFRVGLFVMGKCCFVFHIRVLLGGGAPALLS